MSDNVVRLPVSPQKQETTTIPEFITMSDIDKMTDEELDNMLAAIRSRRLASYQVYKATRDQQNQINEEKARAKVEKKCEQIIKKLNTIDKNMEQLETFIAELRGLRLQAGMEFM